ncbi:type I polyketide synthase [Roseospira visakhapatnamensis]|uniref:Yersiniabactin nonribosomal peptide/polyketide synthase n=1 Tax=Roseospira visakhapatnamensis TaxID=390880 RepID=A0A7W6WB41_9PROT|nr:type I polyketide synthase [Roseospira visakhapatnamensis]MBB4267126.1 yersiniabactin nonribosomal peptide/polyketide synthase [Roseospira visakhapatnamensis]
MLDTQPRYGESEPIAVIGLSGRFPDAPDIEAFWQTLVDGRCVTRAFTDDELSAAGVTARDREDRTFVGSGAVLEAADAFDAALFGYAPAEAELIDPQQRLFLHAAWHALESAGYPPMGVPHQTGVFGSARMSTYPAAREASFQGLSRARGMQALMGNDKDYLCLRVAYKLNLHGPALTVQTACSSSLVAVHIACESLRNGECDMALAGGVGVSFPQCAGYRHQPGMIFSADASCRPFDAQADGTFAGHGLGLVVLRRLEDARRDNDPILAVLRGSAFNNDGNRKVGFTAPSGAGQRDVIREAWAYADVDANDIDLVEAHGTGTPLGDPIEVDALRDAFAGRDPAAGPVALGSLKGNYGHMDTAAGIASLIKAIVAVHRGVIPPSVGFDAPNPALNLARSPFEVPVSSRPWDRPVRSAGVSSFGIGGTNCHVVVQSFPASSPGAGRADTAGDADGYLLLSAASEASLRGLAAAYAKVWRTQPPAALARMALTGRQLDLDWRLTVPVVEDSAEALSAHAQGGSDPLLMTGRRADRRKMAWTFSGLGSQWAGMGRALYNSSAAFAATLDDCADLCGDLLSRPLKDVLFDPDAAVLARPSFAQPALVAFELALADHWRALGLTPDVVLGHSWGEYAAAAVADIYDRGDMLRLAARSGDLMAACEGGAMLAVFADTADLRDQAARAGLDLAADNGVRHLVFSGPVETIKAFSKDLKGQGVRTRAVASGCAAHSRHLDPVLSMFEAYCHDLPPPRPPRVPFVSSITGDLATQETFTGGGYWARQMRETVRYRAAQERLRALEITTYLEIGPSSVLTDMGEREAPDACAWVASCRRGVTGPQAMREAAARLFVAGYDLRWTDLLPCDGPRAPAPAYVFDARPFWWRPRETAAPSRDEAAGVLIRAEGMARDALADIDLPRLSGFYGRITTLHGIYVDRVVEQALGRPLDRPASATEILRAGRFLPRYRQLLVRLLDACVEDGLYVREGKAYRKVREPEVGRLDAIFEALLDDCEGLQGIPETIRRAGEALGHMLSGEVDPVAVIFPSGQSRGVEVLYEDLSYGRYFNRVAAAVVADLCAMRGTSSGTAPAEVFRILEVGGGTGGTTSSVLPVLAEHADVRYEFTDISPIFTRRAETKFAAYPFVRYRDLDLERPAVTQGFEAGRYDLIVAANVVHATRDIAATLANLRPLLKPGGRLLMREITRTVRLFDFVFGPLVAPLADVAARHGELFLSVDGWRTHCRDAGFARMEVFPGPSLETGELCEHVLLASLPGADWGLSSRSPLTGAPVEGTDALCWDMSACAGDDAALRTRLEDVCREELRCGLLGAAPLRLRADAIESPADVTLVRAVTSAGLFGQARVCLEGRRATGDWHPLAVAETMVEGTPDAGLPMPKAAPDTLYQEDLAPLRAADGAPGIAFDGLADDVASALRAGGVSPVPGRRLVMVETASALDAAEQVRTALVQWPQDDLVFVTRRAWAVHDHENIDIDARALWGFLRVASHEARRPIRVADLSADAPWSDLTLALTALQGAVSFVVVRDGVCFAPRVAPVTGAAMPAMLPPGVFETGRWQVVTGAFGGLGRLSARWLARSGARRIALMAHRLPPDGEAFRDHLEDGGRRQVRVVVCDCADPDQVRAAMGVLAADGGVDGVIHAAGILDDAPIETLTPDRMAAVFAVKAGAARVLLEDLTRHGSRYLILYSSAVATLGPRGQGAHALASAFMDALAINAARTKGTARSGAGPRVLSIAWGAWAEVGRAAVEDRLDALAAEGMLALRPDEGLWHLERAMMDGGPVRLAMRLSSARRSDALADADGAAEHPAKARPDAVPDAVADTKDQATSDAASADRVQPDDTARPPTDDAGLIHWLTTCLREHLRLDDADTIDPDDNLMDLGLDSLMFLDLSASIERAFGVSIQASAAYDDLSVSSLRALIQAALPETTDGDAPSDDTGDAGGTVLDPDPAGRFEPFPLTPIQHAYWLGRTDLIGYGGVACHVVFEWDKDTRTLDWTRLEAAWVALVRRHDMLRSVVAPDGRQRVLETVPDYRFDVVDLRTCAPEERQARLEETRRRLSEQVLPTDRWPIFEIVVSLTEGTRYRLHANLDLLQFDTQSFKVMMDDWAALYRGETLAPLGCGFRDYVLAELARKDTPAWKTAWCAWQDLLTDLPAAPELPVRGGVLPSPPRFGALQHRVSATRWAALKAAWRAKGVTPSAALLTLYAHTLAAWARHPRFTMNVTSFNRKPSHPDVRKLIGDFTSVLLVDYDDRQGWTVSERMDAVQQRVWQRLGLADVNGVEVLREWGRLRQGGGQALMPVVFTSMLGMTFDGDSIQDALGSFLGDPVHAFTQTPQVWLDHQVMENAEGLVLNWFFMEDVFPEGLPAAMFAAYTALIDRITDAPDLQDQEAVTVGAAMSAEGDAFAPIREAWRGPLGDDAEAVLRVERALRALPGVRDLRIDPGSAAWHVDVVPDDVLCADEDPAEVPAVRDVSLPPADDQEVLRIDAAWLFLEARATRGLWRTLDATGLFRPGTAVTVEALARHLEAAPKYDALLRQWLAHLTDAGVLRRDGAAYRLDGGTARLAEPGALPFEAPWLSVLTDYLDRSIAGHAALFRGEVSPLDLLFGDDAAVARSLYSDHPTPRLLNQRAATLASALADAWGPLDVLEVGAGTGATTRPVVTALAGRLNLYRFTDVSPAFLRDAEQTFRDVPAMDVALLDVNAPFDMAAHPESGYHVVIAANVLHDSAHVGRTLRRLRRLLKPGGYLLLLEATTRGSALQLASVGFLEGLSAYQDDRILDDQPMLTPDRWRAALTDAGFIPDRQWPEADDTPLRQHVFMARSRGWARPDESEVERVAVEAAGRPLPPLRMRVREILPGPKTASEPADTVSTGAADASGTDAHIDAASAGDDGIPADIVALWEDLLSRPVTEDTDFFASGGDSLMATRLITGLYRRGYTGASLQSLFRHATLRAFCAHLPAKADRRDSSSVLLCDGAAEPWTLVLHASDGDVGAYRHLAEHLGNRVTGLCVPNLAGIQRFEDLAGVHAATVLDQSRYGDPIEVVGWSYGAPLAAAVARRLRQEDRVPSLVLIDPVHRRDVAIDHPAAFYRMMAERDERLSLPPGFEALSETEMLQAFAERVHTAGARPAARGIAEVRDWIQTVRRLLDLLHGAPPPALADGPSLWIEATRRPTDWSRPTDDWPGLSRAVHHRVDAGHWDIMTARRTAAEVATALTRWRSVQAVEERV